MNVSVNMKDISLHLTRLEIKKCLSKSNANISARAFLCKKYNHPENKVKTEAFWFVFKFIYYKIFTNFQKDFGGGGGGVNRKEPKLA